MMRRLLVSCILFLFCEHGFSQEHAVTKPCAGVLINGVCWAESNVDEPGTFAASPEAYGMFYQWNRKKGWPARGEVTGWDSSLPSGDHWEAVNDPCPAGWRVPTIKEIATLQDSTKVTQEKTLQNGVNGRKYTDKLTDNTIFLPAANWRNNTGFYTPNIDLCYWSSSASKQSFRVSALTEYGPGQALGSFGYSVRCIADGNVTSCDSIVKDTSETICEGDLPYTWGDTIFQVGTKTGKYRFQRTSTVTGCDSIVYLNLTVNPSYNTILYDTICQGGFYYKHGFSLREVQSSGSHSLSLLSQSGCDSIVSLHLHIMSCSCAGVLINGVCWAESNVDEPGTFAASPEAYGMFYQWNRKKGWPARGEVTGWDSSLPSGDHWEAVNDPCPAGWRVPTIEEITTLQDSTKVTQEKILQNGVNGRKYTDKLTDNTIFLPAANWRDNTGFYSQNVDICYWSADSSNLPFLVSALIEYGTANTLGYFGYSVRCIADGNVTSCDSIVKDTTETICEGDLPYTWGDTIFQAGTKTGKYRFQRTSTVTSCDSIVYLNLTVNPSYYTILYDTICQGDSYYQYGFSLANVQSGGSHSLSLLSQSGCDSIVSLHLHVMSCSCAGVLINGVCWAESNVDEPRTFAASPEAFGMFYQWNRKKGWPARGEVTGWDISLPPGERWETANDPCPAGWRVPTIEEIRTLLDDSKVTSGATSQNGISGRKYTDKSTGNTIFLPGAGWREGNGAIQHAFEVCYWLNSSRYPIIDALVGYNIGSILGNFGLPVRCVANSEVTDCDSIVKDTSETICEGDLPYTWGDTIFQAGTKTGKYRFQRTSTVTGCDSIVYLSLTVNPEPHLSFTDVVCYGNEYNKNGFYLPAVFADTLVHDTLQSRWGCDSIRSLYLTVNPSYHTILYDTICQGDSYYQHGFSLANVQSGGSHSLSLLSRTGCDSTVSLHLTVLPAFHQTLYDSICPSERYVKYGFDLSDVTASGSFQLSLKTAHGCDSIVTLELYVYPTYLFTRSETICQGDTLDFRGRKLYESGIYYDPLTTAKGCDSIYCMNLTVNPIPHLSFTDAVCYGNGYNKNGFYLPAVFADTLVHDTLQSRWGCDSIRSLYLTVNPLYNTILYDTICQGDSYYQHGFSLTNVQSGGSHSLTLLSGTGCDSTVSLHLTVLPAFHQTLYDSICPSERYVKYGFDLSDVTASGSFQLSLKTVHGCDSIVTLELYVYPTYLFTRSETICQGDTLDFRGRKLYESGVYYDSSTTAKGCDSIYCINLTVNPAYDIQLSRILCEGSSYTEHGFNVSQAGVYHRYLKTNSGCDSIITLSLTEEKKLQGNIGFLLEDCSTHTYTFFFEPEILVISYQWDMGDGTVLRSEKGIHTYADSGVYRIQLRAATLNGCENTLSYIQHVPHYLPEVVLQADRQIIDKEFPTVHFCAEVLPEMTCEWDFGDGTTGEGICVSHTYHPNTEKDYDVTLTVTNTDGCITTSRAQIEVIAFTESINTFSPNGDGINDIFMAGYRVEIVNRNGLRVYVGDNGWDGTYNGKQAPEDTYFYRLYYQTASGERMKTGYVTLIR